MKMTWLCPLCQMEDDYLKYEGNGDGHPKYDIELTGSCVYELTCEKDHKSVYVLHNQTFELLFEMGIYALHDGYSREAASNFAVAVERFHEFCIKVLAHEQGIGPLVNSEPETWKMTNDYDFDKEYNAAWKAMSSQSERQYGAYIMLYLITFKKAPVLLRNSDISFRNDVTHKGLFPTQKRTREYAQTVFDYIRTKLIELKCAMPDAVDFICSKDYEDFKDQQLQAYNGKTLAFIRMETVFQAFESLKYLENLTFDFAIERGSGFRFFK